MAYLLGLARVIEPAIRLSLLRRRWPDRRGSFALGSHRRYATCVCGYQTRRSKRRLLYLLDQRTRQSQVVSQKHARGNQMRDGGKILYFTKMRREEKRDLANTSCKDASNSARDDERQIAVTSTRLVPEMRIGAKRGSARGAVR